MKAVSRRIARLEERFAPTTQDRVKKRLRAIICRVDGGVPDLAKCTAKRTLCPDGTLLEVVRVNGSAKLLDRAKLQEWLRSFPVLTLEAAKREDRRASDNLGDSIFRDRIARRDRLLVFSFHHHDEEDSAFVPAAEPAHSPIIDTIAN